MQALDISRSSAFDLYKVATHEASQINTVLCGLCGYELTWLVDLEDTTVGLLLWHHHLVSFHRRVAEVRLQAVDFDPPVSQGPTTKEVWLHPSIHKSRFSAAEQTRIIDDFRTSSAKVSKHTDAMANVLTLAAIRG